MTQHTSLSEGSVDGKNLSPVLENYLEIIFLEEAREGAVRASSIAESAGVSRSTVTSTLKTLKSMGLVEYEPYSLVHLTSRGRAIGKEIAHRHIIFREFFLRILQLEEKQADTIACELEHVVPSDVVQRWGQFVLYLTSHEYWQTWQDEYRANRKKLLDRMNKAFALPESRAEQIQKEQS
jgi:DtxR family Mn-dependent transcriptional regulator